MDSAANGSGARRFVGVGSSAAAEADAAGREAAERALEGREPALAIVFCPIAYDLTAVAAAVRSVAGSEAPLIGCTTAGEIAGARAGTVGVVVAALGGPGFSARTSAGLLADGARTAGAAAAAGIAEIDAPHRFLLLLSSACATACRRSCSPTRRGSSTRTRARTEPRKGRANPALRHRADRQFFQLGLAGRPER